MTRIDKEVVINKGKPRKSQAAPAKERLQKAVTKATKNDIESIFNGPRSTLSEPAQRWNNFIVNPRDAPPARNCGSDGGYVSASAVIKLKCIVPVTIGTNGVGYIVMNPTAAGPTSDNALARATIATYAGTLASTITSAPTATELAYYWSKAPYAGASALEAAQLMFRCTGFGAYVIPTGSMTNQSGVMHMLEVPGHRLLNNGTTTYQQVVNNDRTREVRGVQVGDPDILNVLNWHPTKSAVHEAASSQIDYVNNDEIFRKIPIAVQTGLVSSENIIIFTGEAGATFEVSIYGGYELIGSKAQSVKPPFYDSRSYDLMRNSWAHKMVSGWVGKPHEANYSYAHAVEAATPAGKQKKSSKDLKSNIPWYKDLYDIAKEVAGFIF